MTHNAHSLPITGGHGSGINPNDLNFSNSYHNNSSFFGDDELLEGLNSPQDPPSGHPGQDYGGMNGMNMGFTQTGIYSSHHSVPMEQSRSKGYSNTPDGDPIQSPFVHGFSAFGHPSFNSSMHFAGSPLANGEMNQDSDPNYLKARARMTSTMQTRKPPHTRSPLTPKSAMVPVGAESPFGPQPIHAGPHHEKTQSGQWIQTPNSLSSFPGSGFSSPVQPGIQSAQISDILLKGGASMPAKLGANGHSNGGGNSVISSQEAKRKRRRESHNLVERRRRDNINERIQDLSKLVPGHRLEDDKIRKAIQNGTPISPTLGGVASPTQATSSLAGPGARRATGGVAGNITTGLPVDDKDKGPNKGDILNGAVSWTRDLMWLLHIKIQQQEELINTIVDLGGRVPFELTDDELRMQSELMDAISKVDEQGKQGLSSFSYSRTSGSGLRVPHHTDFKGEPLGGSGQIPAHAPISPEAHGGNTAGDILESGDFLDYDDDFIKEDEDYGMDLTQ